MPKTTEKPLNNNGGGRGANGRFVRGHAHGFKPGESGNPAGKPKGLALSEYCRRAVREVDPTDQAGRTFGEVIAERLVTQAARGDLGAVKELFDRLEGRARQALDIDMSVGDWREQARAAGLDEADVIAEAKLLLEESADNGGASEGD